LTCALARAITFSSTPSVLTAHSRCLRDVPRARLLHGARRTSLPLQSAAYASASTRALCAPQRAHNAVSLCQCALPCDRLAWKFGGRALPPQLQRVLALSPPRLGRLPSALLRTTCDAATSPASLARFQRATVAVEVLQRPPPFGEPDEEALRPTPLPAGSCRTACIERNGSAQKSPVCCRVQQTSPR